MFRLLFCSWLMLRLCSYACAICCSICRRRHCIPLFCLLFVLICLYLCRLCEPGLCFYIRIDASPRGKQDSIVLSFNMALSVMWQFTSFTFTFIDIYCLYNTAPFLSHYNYMSSCVLYIQIDNTRVF